MQVITELLGEVQYEEQDIIYFEEGLYGFDQQKKFILLDISETDFPFQCLQSIEDENLSFILTNPFAFCETYDFEIGETISENLGLDQIENLAVYSLVVLREELTESTINLKAPIIMNVKNNQAQQIILNEDYPYKYLIFRHKEG